MQSFICETCGTGYAPAETAPESCKICEDERQYVNPYGQSWTNLKAINHRHKNIIEKVADNLYAIYTTPSFAINQRAHLLITPKGNILWDCIANLDNSTIDLINKLGGIAAIALSHPHYYTTMAEWSHSFLNAPVYIHQNDAAWLSRRDFNLQLWEGNELEIMPGLTLINAGGHFDGGTILHYEKLMLVGDVLQVCPDLKTISFMYSYPNYIPLSKKAILRIQELLHSYTFNTMYGAFGRYIIDDAKAALDYSLKRYLKIFE